MKISIFLFLVTQFTFVNLECVAQSEWQVSGKFGVQMSGIKDEDFIAQNVAPLFHIALAKKYTEILSLRAGYRGPYFNTIADKDRHLYSFFFGDAVFDLHQRFAPEKESTWNLNVFLGAGLFYNHYYQRPNIAADLGLISSFQINEKWSADIELGFIMAWDIYQNNDDILPGICFGVSYKILGK
jgi:hypothetical protein